MASVDPVWIPIILFSAAPIIAIGMPIARAYARRLERGTAEREESTDVIVRLERIERAVEAMSIEVERIAEGQRFTTKLLSEREHAPGAIPGAIPSAIPGAIPDALPGVPPGARPGASDIRR